MIENESEIVKQDKKVGDTDKEKNWKAMNNGKDVQTFTKKPTVGELKKLAAAGEKFFINDKGNLINIQKILDSIKISKPNKNSTLIPRPNQIGNTKDEAEWDSKYGNTHNVDGTLKGSKDSIFEDSAS